MAVEGIASSVLNSNKNVQERSAFIIDSLKHPEEVEYLRRVFGNSYFPIGVVSTDSKRRERLCERKNYTKEIFDHLSKIDRKEGSIQHGQRAVDTVLKSDYYFANNYSTKDKIEPEISRALGLVFNSTMITPRRDEFAMNIAFKASARSACLSRQVGSAIVDKTGRVIATGCNDVPKFRGGLYSTEDEEDMRCWAKGAKCYNDEEKTLIENELKDSFSNTTRLEEILKKDDEQNLGFEASEIKEKLVSFLSEILKTSRIRQLIEFSRAVHAEMNAIMAIARSGKPGLAGSTLYCTTYPCHNCAKHIIDAGITELVYLEPYEKSLAIKLHSDAINDSSEEREDNQVLFKLYNGVSPNRYSELFEMGNDRKKNGTYIDRSTNKSILKPYLKENATELLLRIQREHSAYEGLGNQNEQPRNNTDSEEERLESSSKDDQATS